MRMIEKGRMYKHFKGGIYLVRHIAEHTETGEAIVVYSKLKSDGILEIKTYARPYSKFISKVDKEKYPKAAQEYRFELIEE